MSLNEFIEAVIIRGIDGAKKDYSNPNNKNHPLMLEGAIAGFEACRGLEPTALVELLSQARINTRRAEVEDLPDYWKHRCFEREIEWVCKCVSAVLVNEGAEPLVMVTALPMLCANEILNAERKEKL
jgi:hypothetical protein